MYMPTYYLPMYLTQTVKKTQNHIINKNNQITLSHNRNMIYILTHNL